MPQRFKIVIRGKSYTVEVGDLSQSPIVVVVNGETYEIELEKEAPRAGIPQVSTVRPASPPAVGVEAPARPRARPEADSKTIRAPMPGRVLAIKLKPGDRLKPGDEVCVLEAMKMEQSIPSDREGLVKAVLVTAGQAVSYGQALAELA